MTASSNAPDPDPKTEVARLAYLEMLAPADARYAEACAADAKIAADNGAEADWASFAFDHETGVTCDQYLAVWHEARIPEIGTVGEPDSRARTARDPARWRRSRVGVLARP